MTERSVSKTRKLTAAAILAAAAYLLAFLEFPVPLTPAFARMDLSDLPALIGAFAFGPVTGVMVELVKNLLGLMTSSTGGVGELANFLMGASYVFTAGAVYKHRKTKRMALIGGVAGSIAMGIMAAITNYFILLPIPFIHTKLDVVLYNAFPFNVLKGLVITAVTMLIYKKLSPILKGSGK